MMKMMQERNDAFDEMEFDGVKFDRWLDSLVDSSITSQIWRKIRLDNAKFQVRPEEFSDEEIPF